MFKRSVIDHTRVGLSVFFLSALSSAAKIRVDDSQLHCVIGVIGNLLYFIKITTINVSETSNDILLY